MTIDSRRIGWKKWTESSGSVAQGAKDGEGDWEDGGWVKPRHLRVLAYTVTNVGFFESFTCPVIKHSKWPSAAPTLFPPILPTGMQVGGVLIGRNILVGKMRTPTCS